MPNKNYIKGRKKEYTIVNNLKADGWEIVQRSAGSHSPIDVFAINKLTRVIKLIQAKPDSMPKSQREKLEKDLNWLNNMFRVEFEVI